MRDVEFRTVATMRDKQVVIEWMWISTDREASRMASAPFQSLASCMADAEDYEATRSPERS